MSYNVIASSGRRLSDGHERTHVGVHKLNSHHPEIESWRGFSVMGGTHPVNGFHQLTHALWRRVLGDAVSQIEDVARPSSVRVQHASYSYVDCFGTGQQNSRVEIALQ